MCNQRINTNSQNYLNHSKKHKEKATDYLLQICYKTAVIKTAWFWAREMAQPLSTMLTPKK